MTRKITTATLFYFLLLLTVSFPSVLLRVEPASTPLLYRLLERGVPCRQEGVRLLCGPLERDKALKLLKELRREGYAASVVAAPARSPEELFKRRLAEAKRRLKEGDLTGARVLLLALRNTPYGREALALLEEKTPAERAVKTIKKKPSDPRSFYEAGLAYERLGRTKEAYRFYLNAYRLGLKDAELLKALLRTSLALGKLNEAYRYARLLKRAGVEDRLVRLAEALYYAEKARELLKEGRTEEALKLALKAYDLAPDEEAVLFVLGDAYLQAGKPEEAYRYYAKAYELKRDFDALLKLLYALTKMRNFELVNAFLKEVKPETLTRKEREKLKAFYRYLYTESAAYFLSEKEFKKALRAAREGLLVFPNEPALLKLAGWACFNLNDLNCAREQFKKALKLKPDDADALYGLALTYARAGKKKEAERLAEKLLTLAPEMRPKLARLYLMLGEPEKAKRLLEPLYEPLFYNPFLKGLPRERSLLEELNLRLAYPHHEELTLLARASRRDSPALSSLTTYALELKGLKRLKDGLSIAGELRLLALKAGNGETFRGLEPLLGLRTGRRPYAELLVGSTPLGDAPVEPTHRYFIRLVYDERTYGLELKLKRDAVRESLVSFVGYERDGLSWGRVVEEGPELYARLGDRHFLALKTGYLTLKGKRVRENWRFFAEAYPAFYFELKPGLYGYLGAYALYESFAHDEQGDEPFKGGYFSPYDFTLTAGKLTLYGRSPRLIWRLNA
ncbi:MAG: tetratricopeptide repeat protein, partial [Aquificae bacterium]|nr:tetratricopeptide repeat protein [Aquificota bacterium]